jgi:hypothetical protein
MVNLHKTTRRKKEKSLSKTHRQWMTGIYMCHTSNNYNQDIELKFTFFEKNKSQLTVRPK